MSVTDKWKYRKPVKATRILGNSVLRRNRQDQVSGRGGRTRQRLLHRKHLQSLFSKLKLHALLIITVEAKHHHPKIERTTRTKWSRRYLRDNRHRYRRFPYSPASAAVSRKQTVVSFYLSASCHTPFQSLAGEVRRKT